MTNAITITSNDARRLMVIVSRSQASTPVEFVMAGAKMQMLHELKERMKTEVVEFYFIKKDGSTRRAFGTTQHKLATSHIKGTGIRRESVNTVAFFDVEAGNWRSLRFESIVKVC